MRKYGDRILENARTLMHWRSKMRVLLDQFSALIPNCKLNLLLDASILLVCGHVLLAAARDGSVSMLDICEQQHILFVFRANFN